MLTRIVMMCLALMPFAIPAEAGLWDSIKQVFSKETVQHPMIKVLIEHDQPSAVLEVKGKYRLYDPNTNSHVSTRRHGKQGIIQTQNDGLKWSEGFPGVYQLHVVPDDRNTKILVNGKEYPGSIYIYDIGGSISIINEITLERYLRMVLTQHLPEALPQETLSAITITARTLAYYETTHSRNPYWSVDAEHVGYEGALEHYSESVLEAVKSTHDMILSASDTTLKPFPAHWKAVSGAKPYNTHGVVSRISLTEAEEMAHKGDDASLILKKAFPDTYIQLIRDQ